MNMLAQLTLLDSMQICNACGEKIKKRNLAKKYAEKVFISAIMIVS